MYELLEDRTRPCRSVVDQVSPTDREDAEAFVGSAVAMVASDGSI